MEHGNLRTILEGLDNSISILREESYDAGQDQEVETEAEGIEALDDLEDQEWLDPEEALEAIGKEAALNLFGKSMDDFPFINQSLEHVDKFEATEKLLPFLEDFNRLNKPLYEAVEPTIYTEHVERAAALYVLSEASGLDYDFVLDLDEDQIAETLCNLTEDQIAELAFLAPLAAGAARVGAGVVKGAAALGRGGLAVGKKVIGGAAKLAGRGARAVGRGAKAVAKGGVEVAGRAAGEAAAERLAKKARQAVQPQQSSVVGCVAGALTEGRLSDQVTGLRASLAETHEAWGLPGSPKLPKERGQVHRNPAPSQSGYGKNYTGSTRCGMNPRGSGPGDKGTGGPYPKGQDDRHPTRGSLATAGIPVSEAQARRAALWERLKKVYSRGY